MLSVACRVAPGDGFVATLKLNEEPVPLEAGRVIEEGLPVIDHKHGEVLKFTVPLPTPSPKVKTLGVGEEQPTVMARLKSLDDVIPPDTTVIAAVPADAIRLAETGAVSWPAFTNVVDNPEPFHCTDAPERNPLPLTVSVNADPPTVALAGFREVSMGVGLLTRKLRPLDVSPPDTTVIVAVPAAVVRLAETGAVSWPAFTNVVTNPEPFHCTDAPERNPLPLTVSVNAGPPAVALVGFRDVSTGVGLLIGKFRLLEVSPPDTTVIVAVPADAIRLAETGAVSWPAFTNVVYNPEPFHCTDAPERNPLPLTVSVNADPPTVALVGFRDVSMGVGLLTGKLKPLDVSPPDTTVIVAVVAAVIRLAGTAAVSWPAFTNVVDNPEPFHCTDAPERNPLPLTVSVNADPPTVALVGFRDVSMGVGLLTGKLKPLDVSPPDTTVIVAVVAAVIRLAGTAALSWPAFTNVVDNPEPFHCTDAPERNPLPLTVSVNADPPTVALVGFRDVSMGVGLLTGKLKPLDVSPPDTTVIVAVVAAVIRLAGTAAVSWPAFTNVVDNPEPFHCTDAPERNPLPLTVSVNADAAAVALVGFRDVRTGVGLLTGKLKPLDVSPPDTTVIVAVPAEVIRLAGTAAVSSPALTKLVDRLIPFQSTDGPPERNTLPKTSSVKAGPPAVALVGLSEVITGLGPYPVIPSRIGLEPLFVSVMMICVRAWPANVVPSEKCCSSRT